MHPCQWPEYKNKTGQCRVGCSASNFMQQLCTQLQLGTVTAPCQLHQRAQGSNQMSLSSYLDGNIVLINLKVGPPEHPQVLAWHQTFLLHWHIAGASCCCCIALLCCLLLWGSVGAHFTCMSGHSLLMSCRTLAQKHARRELRCQYSAGSEGISCEAVQVFN